MKIIYLWNFKPGESAPLPTEVVRHNQKFVQDHDVITPEGIETLLEDPTFPSLPELYAGIPHWIIRSDLGRLLMVYFQGGIYSDADCFFNKPFAEATVLLFVEKICASVDELGPRESKHPDNVVRIANYCFGAAEPRHPFFREVIDECLRRLSRLEPDRMPTQEDILWVCGPDVITTIYHRTKHTYPEIVLHDPGYLTHKCTGSWR